jgi:hypothetical protein
VQADPTASAVVGAIRNRMWSPKEPSSQHNPYVDQLLQLLQQLSSQIGGLATPLPAAVSVAVLEEATRAMAELLVESYVALKKVSDEGRALMMRDVKVLAAALDNLQRRGMLPAGASLSMAYAESFVHALSLPLDSLLEWARRQRGLVSHCYSIRHLSAIVTGPGVLATALKKKDQQEALAALQ